MLIEFQWNSLRDSEAKGERGSRVRWALLETAKRRRYHCKCLLAHLSRGEGGRVKGDETRVPSVN